VFARAVVSLRLGIRLASARGGDVDEYRETVNDVVSLFAFGLRCCWRFGDERCTVDMVLCARDPRHLPAYLRHAHVRDAFKTRVAGAHRNIYRALR